MLTKENQTMEMEKVEVKKQRVPQKLLQELLWWQSQVHKFLVFKIAPAKRSLLEIVHPEPIEKYPLGFS